MESRADLKRNVVALNIGMSILNMGIAIATTLLSVYLNVLGYSGTTIGLVNTVAAVATSLVSIPAGRLSDMIGRKMPIVASCLLTAVVGFIVYFTDNPLVVAFMIVLNGVALGIRTPALNALISESEPESTNKMTFTFSVFYTATLIGTLLGTMPSGALSNLYGFPFLFLLLAIFSLVATPFAWILREPPYISKRAVERKLTLHVHVSFREFYETMKKNRSLFLFAIALMFHSFCFSVFYPYISLYALTDIKLDNVQAGLIISAWNFGLLLTQIPFGKLADRKGAFFVLTAHLVLSSVVWAIFPLSQNFTTAIIIMVLFGTVGSMDMPARRTLTFWLATKEKLAFSIGYIEFAVGFGGIFGYAVGGLLWDNLSHASPFIVAAAINIVGVPFLIKAGKAHVLGSHNNPK